MKGYTIQHSIDLLEKAVENGTGGGGSTSAANVSYTNTTSGLVATNVQSAIDEIDSSVDGLLTTVGGLSTDVGTLKDGHVYSTTEQVIGKWIDNTPIYEKVIEIGALPNTTVKTVAHSITDLKLVVSIFACAHNSTNGNDIIVPTVSNINLTQQVGLYIGSGNVNVISASDVSAYDSCYAIVRYVKNEPTRTSKKK